MTKKIFITGGTSGIGEAILKNYQDLGFLFYIVSRKSHKNTDNKKYIQVDLSDSGQFIKLNTTFTEIKFDRVILGAGYSNWGDFFNITDNEDLMQFSVNFTANLYILKNVKLNPDAKILFISSTSSFTNIPNQLVYSLSKMSFSQLFHSLYKPLQRQGVHSTLLIPSSTNTAFWDKRPNVDRSKFSNSNTMALKAYYDFEKGLKYSTPTLSARIQLYLTLILPHSFFSIIKKAIKLKR